MDSEKDSVSRNRELTPSEQRFALGILVWFATCFFTGIISPKLGITLLALGVLITVIAMLAIHMAG